MTAFSFTNFPLSPFHDLLQLFRYPSAFYWLFKIPPPIAHFGEDLYLPLRKGKDETISTVFFLLLKLASYPLVKYGSYLVSGKTEILWNEVEKEKLKFYLNFLTTFFIWLFSPEEILFLICIFWTTFTQCSLTAVLLSEANLGLSERPEWSTLW